MKTCTIQGLQLIESITNMNEKRTAAYERASTQVEEMSAQVQEKS